MRRLLLAIWLWLLMAALFSIGGVIGTLIRLLAIISSKILSLICSSRLGCVSGAAQIHSLQYQ